VKRRAWPVLLMLALGLLGVDSPFPSPVVVVYPLTGTGGTPADVGGNVAILLSTKLAQLGGLTVKPYTPGTERAQFLSSAVKAGADYYITGYLAPVGPEVSLIAQVVSTHSGSIVYSTSSVVRTYGDVIGQADVLREAILRHAGRGFPAVDQPAAVQTGTPVPSATNGVNLTRALGRHERNSSTPAPSAAPSNAALGFAPPASSPTALPAPSPTQVRRGAPVPTIAPTVVPSVISSSTPRVVAVTDARGNFSGLVTLVDGDGTAAQRNQAQLSLVIALHNAGMKGGGGLPVSAADGTKNAKALCDANAGTRLVFASTLALGSGTYGKNSATLSVRAYGCDGSQIAAAQAVENAGDKGGISTAIDRAAASVAAGIRKQIH
jgi:hypothetical protein